MWQLYVFGFFAALFITNGIPHIIKGITGQQHQTPFGKPSSAIVNVVWGWVNLIIGTIFLYLADIHASDYVAISFFALIALLKALGSARNWSKHPEHNS